MKKYKDFMNIIANPLQTVPDEMLMLFFHNGTFNQPEWRYGLDGDGNPKPPFCALWCDDLQSSKIMTSKALASFTLRHRHCAPSEDNTPSLGISMFFCQQTYKSSNGGTPRWMRQNMTAFICFKTANAKERDSMADELSGEIPRDTFLEMLDWATREPYGFLMVDLAMKVGIHPSGFRRGFNNFLMPSDPCEK